MTSIYTAGVKPKHIGLDERGDGECMDCRDRPRNEELLTWLIPIWSVLTAVLWFF